MHLRFLCGIVFKIGKSCTCGQRNRQRKRFLLKKHPRRQILRKEHRLKQNRMIIAR
mgnify:CR=1 FL=1